MALGVDTHTCQRGNQSNFKKPGSRGLWPCEPGLINKVANKACGVTISDVISKGCVICYE